MAFPFENSPSKHSSAQRYDAPASHSQNLYSNYQPHKPSADGYRPQSVNGYESDGHFDLNYTHSNSVPRHIGYANQPPLRACGVAVPPASLPFPPPAHSHPLIPAVASPSNGVFSKPRAPQPAPTTPPVDHQLLLLSLAEEYFEAAYGRGSMLDVVERDSEMQEYYKLITTGLGCLEGVLKHSKMNPDREAVVILRYATVLYEETENIMEAEEALNKGISLCDRHRFYDLKYNMQYLLTRIVFRKNSRASFKYLDGILKDAEAYQHIAWVYSFRFLKTSLHLELSSHQNFTLALSQLRSIALISTECGDKAILSIATVLEALICLGASNDAESFEQAQRALATVRSLQMSPAMSNQSHLKILASFADLCCCLQHFDPNQAFSKMQIMQKLLENISESQSWMEDGSIVIPIPSARMPSCQSRSGVIRRQEDDSLVLILNWMPKEDIQTVGYLLSGVAMAHRSATDGRKSEQMLVEGVRRQLRTQQASSKLPKSVMLTASQRQWRDQMTCYMRLHLAFTLCSRTAWTGAKEQLSHLTNTITAWVDPATPILLLTNYLSGVIAQGTGELTIALSIFQKQPTIPSPTSPLQHSLSLLSTLSTLLIIRSPSHPSHPLLSSLLPPLRQPCLSNPNLQIFAAYHLLAATLPTSNTILLTKQSLQSALQAAKASSNNQLMCIVLNLMSWKFFRGVVGEQAEKSARASQTLAKKGGDELWCCVSAAILGDTLEAAGRGEEAMGWWREGEGWLNGLPERVRAALEEHDGGTPNLGRGAG